MESMVSLLLTLLCLHVGFMSAANVTYDEAGNLVIGIVIVHEKERSDVPSDVAKAFAKVFDRIKGLNLQEHYVEYDKDRLRFVDDEQFCTALAEGVALLLDVTWIDTGHIADTAERYGIPYFHADLSVQTYVRLMEHFLQARTGNDVVYLLPGPHDADATVYLLITGSLLRAIVFDGLDATTVDKIKAIRPYPSFYAVIAGTQDMDTILEMAIDGGLVRKPEKWNLLFTDLHGGATDFAHGPALPGINRLLLDEGTCCILLLQETAVAPPPPPSRPCVCPPEFDPMSAHLDNVLYVLLRWASELPVPLVYASNCSTENGTTEREAAFSLQQQQQQLLEQMGQMAQFWITQESRMIRPNLNLSIIGDPPGKQFTSNKTAVTEGRTTGQPLPSVTTLGSIQRGQVTLAENSTLPEARRFFRVGTTESIPWAYRKRHPVSGKIILDRATGEPTWEGYCIDFLHQLSVVMNFDYDIVTPRNGTFGQRDSTTTTTDGRWDGLVGELVVGDIDFAIASLKMTAEREEVVDFVAPYFEQTGILIAMRKPVRETSLFKFMTVLRLEVWLSILLAIVATAIMLWLLDKFSPYSARNNKQAYPYECRDFTLKESFWFALTSFTPQGGGEAPKALSGRTLVAAYWLFVVLMLATFTANLAAFLTVERMQTPVQSLEQLSRQSRIKYTVVQDSDTHDYFRNMKHAEDVLYQMWRNLTLSSGNDQAQYRVWDYPIKEQYINILAAIESADPVASAADGFRRVNERLDADFAFIHDSAEIRYEVSRNCNLTVVGEVFAEQPYGIAVQQGSHLQDELSYFILELQKERYFESLTAKFWNNSARGQCPNTDDSEGITLESLGGVFIATLVGLALAMVTLFGEVLYYRRKERNRTFVKVLPFDGKEQSIAVIKNIFNHRVIDDDHQHGGGGGAIKRNTTKATTNKANAIPKDITFGKKFISVADKQPKMYDIAILPRKPLH